MPSHTIEPLNRTVLAPWTTSRTPTKVALLVASVSEPLASFTCRSPTMPEPLKLIAVSVALPSILS